MLFSMQSWSRYNEKQRSNELGGRVLAVNGSLALFSNRPGVTHVSDILFWELIAEGTVTSLLLTKVVKY